MAEAHVSSRSITDWGLGEEGKGYHSSTAHTSPRSSLVPLPSRKEGDAKHFLQREFTDAPIGICSKEERGKEEAYPRREHPAASLGQAIPCSSQLPLCPPATHFLRLDPRRPVVTLLHTLCLSSKSSGCWIQKSHRMRGDFAFSQSQAELVHSRF